MKVHLLHAAVYGSRGRLSATKVDGEEKYCTTALAVFRASASASGRPARLSLRLFEQFGRKMRPPRRASHISAVSCSASRQSSSSAVNISPTGFL